MLVSLNLHIFDGIPLFLLKLVALLVLVQLGHTLRILFLLGALRLDKARSDKFEVRPR